MDNKYNDIIGPQILQGKLSWDRSHQTQYSEDQSKERQHLKNKKNSPPKSDVNTGRLLVKGGFKKIKNKIWRAYVADPVFVNTHTQRHNPHL